VQVKHRVVNGCNEWNHQPEGYEPLPIGSTVQRGDVIRLATMFYREYLGNGLVGKLVEKEGKWFRKQ